MLVFKESQSKHSLTYSVKKTFSRFLMSSRLGKISEESNVQQLSYIQKSNTEIQSKSLSRIGTKLWNEIPS